MKFSDLSDYFKKLEKTSSRNAMIEILAELFRRASTEEIGKLCYLLGGRVVPLYEAIEFGVAERLVMRAIARAYGKGPEEVLSTFKKMGDLGTTAEALHKGKGTNATVSDVYEKLYEIATNAGSGSQEKKIALLSELFSSVDALSARYLARIPLDKLRLGFSDMTILDALSWMTAGDKSLRGKIEAVYNIRPDIGLLAQTVKEKGTNGLGTVKVKAGAPILAALCQRLGNADEMIKKMGKVAVEPKYDGVRCISGYTRLLTLNRGYLSARNVRVGDTVLTHKGKFRTVTAVARRLPKHGEKFYCIQTMMGDRITTSETHRFFVFRDGTTQWVEAKDITVTDWHVFPIINRQNQSLSQYLLLEDTAGYGKSIPYSEDFFRFLGFWVGDGFTNNSHQSERIGLTFNAKTEKALADEYEQIIRSTLKIREVSKNERGGGLNLYWRDPTLRKWITSEFRYTDQNGDHGKSLPTWMFTVARKQFLAFMRGWQEADGTERHGGGNRITTKERKLASCAVLLGSAFGYLIGVRSIRAKATPNGLTKTYYELIIPGTDRYYRHSKNENMVKVRSIECVKLHPRTHVYDFQIEKDESFCASLVSLHNCQIHVEKSNVKTFSRNLENTTDMFPELREIGKQLHARDVILDSEAVGYDAKTGRLFSFQETTTRKRKHDIPSMRVKVPLKFFVFDVLYKDGKDLLNLPLSDRRSVLEATVKNGNLLMISPQIVTEDAGHIREYHDEQIKKGLEGVVVKKWESSYEPGRRGYNWVKYKEEGRIGKLTDTIDAVIMGYYRGEGKRAGFGIGAFLVGVRKGESFVTVTKIGTGVSDELWKDLRTKLNAIKASKQPKVYEGVSKLLTPDVWVEPKIVVELAGDDLTKSPNHGAGIAVRFPRLVRIRTDKSPEQATTVKEVETMYQLTNPR